MTTSGTYNWFMDNADIVLEAFSRCGKTPTELTREHWQSARRSINLEMVEWSIKKQPNLWTVDLQTIALTQGQATYTLDPQTITVLDIYLEQYTFGTNINQAVNYSTINGSTLVKVTQPNHGLLQGLPINIVIPVAIANLLLQGFYIIASVVDANNYNITSAVAATSTVNNAGAVPQFVATLNSSTITVNLANHGQTLGSTFNVQAATVVGGITLFGPYAVAAVNSASQFTITAPLNATANDTEYENGNQTWIQTSTGSADPTDILLKQISRTEYAAYPDKVQQGRPTVVWNNRNSPLQSFTIWPVPNATGIYTAKFYRMRRLQDANVSNEETPDVPYKMLEALCAGMAKRLALKYAMAKFSILKGEAAEAFDIAFGEDRETNTDLIIRPDIAPYWQV
jgi:hypothetical protein